MKKFLSWFKDEESGQGMVEYALIIALIAVALFLALSTLEGGIAGIFGKISTKLNGTT